MNSKLDPVIKIYSDVIQDRPWKTTIVRQPEGTTHVRLWKLGNLEHKIIPTAQAFAKLSQLILDWDGKSSVDIIWGPDLELEIYEL